MDCLYNGRDGVITDSENLYYMRARYYSTDLKRFLSEDAFAGKYDNLLGLNLYGYVNGNPVQYVDPSGYFTEQYPGGGDAAGIAGIYITKLLNSPDLYNDLNLAASDYANKDNPALTADVISVFLAGVDAGTIKLGGKSVREFLEALVKNSEDLPAGLRKLFESGLDALSTPSSKVLRQNMIEAGSDVPDYANAAHHIVAGSSPKAAEARAILQKFGVNINDAANGVFLPTIKNVAEGTYHPSLHTDSYYRKISDLLSGAKCKNDVLDILDDIADQLSNGTF